MRSEGFGLVALAVVVLGLAGCAADSSRLDAPVAPLPDRIGRDLVGTEFVFFEDADGARTWTIEADEVREVVLRDTVTSADGRTHRARVAVTLASQNRTIRGELLVYYCNVDGLWGFDRAARADARNFTVAERAAVLYAARPAPVAPEDTLVDRRRVHLDVIARYAEGTYTAPFEPYADAIDDVLDRPRPFYRKPPFDRVLRDSLYTARIDSLSRVIARRYFNPSWTLFLLQPGTMPKAVRVRESEAAFDGCQYLTGIVRAPSDAAAQEVSLATTSSVMGGTRTPGQVLAPEDERVLLGLARDAFAALGVRSQQLDRLRVGRTLALDLTGDDLDDWLGAFSIAHPSLPGVAAHALVLGVDPNAPTPRVILERYADPHEGLTDLALEGALDIDGDGRLDLILRESGYEVYQYLILTNPGGTGWREAFRGGGGGC
ncbi:MAG: hypothetical protein HKN04_06910 [Rhodothermaceae bacterium]|nr:hypothetical protein [Rhodothermaceae bacterium]